MIKVCDRKKGVSLKENVFKVCRKTHSKLKCFSGGGGGGTSRDNPNKVASKA